MEIERDSREVFLCYAFTTAVECGITYWADVKDYKYGEDHKGDIVEASCYVRDFEAEDDEEWTFITQDDVEVGIQRILHKPGFKINPTLWKDLAWADRENDADDVDADLADCIIQAAIFGKLVYG